MLDIAAETVHRPVSLYNERITICLQGKMCSVMLIYTPFVIGNIVRNAVHLCVYKEEITQAKITTTRNSYKTLFTAVFWCRSFLYSFSSNCIDDKTMYSKKG